MLRGLRGDRVPAAEKPHEKPRLESHGDSEGTLRHLTPQRASAARPAVTAHSPAEGVLQHSDTFDWKGRVQSCAQYTLVELSHVLSRW